MRDYLRKQEGLFRCSGGDRQNRIKTALSQLDVTATSTTRGRLPINPNSAERFLPGSTQKLAERRERLQTKLRDSMFSCLESQK